MAPSSNGRAGCVISLAGSHSVTAPSPLHTGHAPCSEFGEKNDDVHDGRPGWPIPVAQASPLARSPILANISR